MLPCGSHLTPIRQQTNYSDRTWGRKGWRWLLVPSVGTCWVSPPTTPPATPGQMAAITRWPGRPRGAASQSGLAPRSLYSELLGGRWGSVTCRAHPWPPGCPELLLSHRSEAFLGQTTRKLLSLAGFPVHMVWLISNPPVPPPGKSDLGATTGAQASGDRERAGVIAICFKLDFRKEPSKK